MGLGTFIFLLNCAPAFAADEGVVPYAYPCGNCEVGKIVVRSEYYTITETVKCSINFLYEDTIDYTCRADETYCTNCSYSSIDIYRESVTRNCGHKAI